MRRLALLILPIAVIASAFAPARAAVKFSDVRFTVSDGVKIVADVYLPDAGIAGAPYPCVVEHTPYRKENRATEGASLLPGRGIALIELDARGSAGSQGEYDIVFSIREQRDVAEIIEIVATTGIPGVGDVCLEKVGMYGGSYSGIIQYLVATLPAPWYPEHLAAIAPQRAYGDLYRDIVYHGGMVIGSFGLIWSAGTTAYYTAPPLDIANPDGQSAWVDHLTKNEPIILNYLANPYSDATWTSNDSKPAWSQKLYEDSSALPRISNLKVPALHLSGWFDAFTRGQTLMFQEALKVERPGAPNYMIIGPWNHASTHFITPQSRDDFHDILAGWYLHWLDDGSAPSFMSGARLQYYLMGTGALLDTTGEWRSTSTWPIPATPTRYYLRGGGGLSTTAPGISDASSASYVWNPTAGTGEILGRWDNTAGIPMAPMPAWDQRTDSWKGLSYSTEALSSPVKIAGPINLHLVATTTGLEGVSVPEPPAGLGQLVPPYHDTDFVVKLSDVAEDGTATLITNGYLRASHRQLDPANSECWSGTRVSCLDGGDVVRPFHYHDAAHVAPPGTTQNVYEIEILPTAKTFAAGHRLQIDIYAADTPNHLTLLKPAMNTVFHTPGAESWLLLPLLPA